MPKKKPDEQTDLQRLHEWINAVNGNILLGESTLEDLETSKNGNKLTIVREEKKAGENTLKG